MWLLRTIWVWFIRGLGLERTLFVVLAGIGIIVMIYWMFFLIDLLPDDPIISMIDSFFTSFEPAEYILLAFGIIVDIPFVSEVISFLVLIYPAVLLTLFVLKYVTKGR
jgi:hypothetical protein